jgi:hypothetical protein
LATGRKVEEVSKLQRENINAAVGGLPQASSHAAQLALDTLSLALSRMRNVPAHA